MHERKNVIEFQEIFLKEINSLLSYFIKFEKDGRILPKEYISDWVVGDLNR